VGLGEQRQLLREAITKLERELPSPIRKPSDIV
jgi:hypothetical protein